MKFRKAVVLALLCMLAVTVVLPIMGCDNATNSSTSGGTGTGGTSGSGGEKIKITSDSFKYNDTEASDWEYASVSQKSGDLSLPFLSKDSIKSRLKQTDPSLIPNDANKLMESPVGYTAPYSKGTVQEGVLILALERLNNFRRIAGLHPVTADTNLTNSAQTGAALIAITNTGGHGKQPQPNGMDKSFYDAGIAATAKCNLATSPRPIEIVGEFLDDFGGSANPHSNKAVGHRMKMLDARLTSVGFGLAPSKPEGGLGAFLMNYNNLPNAKHKDMGDWNFVAWPSPGYFPLNARAFDLHQGQFPRWSIVFNRAEYPFGISQPDKSKVTITCVKGSDGKKGKTWEYRAGTPNMYMGSGEIVFPDTSNYGYKQEPILSYVFYIDDNTHRYEDGDVYKIQITSSGGNVIAEYYTEFFDSTK